MSFDIAETGEFGFIAELRKRFSPGEGVETGLGDDAAVVRVEGQALVTTDMLVEGVHFNAAWSSAVDVGFKAMAASASDIAAMGGRPTYAVVALGLPHLPRLNPMGLADGIGQAAEEFGFSVVGGDTTSAPITVITVTMMGRAGRAGPVLRSTARAGDLLCVTGAVGGAAAGAALLGRDDDDTHKLLEAFPSLAVAHRRGCARVREGAIAAGLATAMIDVSDGVGADANHLAEESALGLQLQAENVPASPGVGEVSRLLGIDPGAFTLAGGDDYELLIAVSPHDVGDLRDALAPAPLTVIGDFTKHDERVALLPDGEKRSLAALGWDHFR